MPSLPITTSPNIAILDSKLQANLCVGNFIIDITPSVWISTGYNNVIGAKVQIINPYGVTVRDYPDNYDITPAFSGGMKATASIAVPTQAGTYQYGKYAISIKLTDADGTVYVITKPLSICAPNSLDSSKKYGNLSAKLTGVCNEGKVYVLVDNLPTYKGFNSESSTQGFTLDYPSGSGKSSFNTPQGSFAVQLFEGEYKIKGSVCATYNYGDNVYAKINYIVNYTKGIICSLDIDCVFSGLNNLAQKLNSDCSEAEKKDTQIRINAATLLIDTIDFGVKAGEDVSDYIFNLEDVLGVTCSCSFNNGTPIFNNDPSRDVLIQGCNVEKEIVGLTTIYTINNYSYYASVSPNGGVLNVTDVVLNGCVQSQNITFNIGTAYDQIKGLANSSLVESNFWSAVIKKSLNNIDATCLGLSPTQLQNTTLDGLVQAMIAKSCAGATCTSSVDSITSTQNGGDVIIRWTETNAYSLHIYVDGELKSTVLGNVNSYTLADYADGATHTYRVVSRCSNGVFGTALQSTFGYTGCPQINTPTGTTNNVYNATCPYDLTGLIYGLPTGIEAEWHNANNHLSSSLIADPTKVSDGVYYVFSTNGANCYSQGVKVIVTCAVSSSCSAPQNVTVTSIIGGLKVAFLSALYPPPSNSYTVKRKHAASADIDGSYTIIGTANFNVSTGKWEITDNSAVNNTLYTYKAISNCAVPQSTLVNFANITCPTIALTVDNTSESYSFSPLGGEIDKYEVEIWDSAGITKIHTDTYTPSFTNPISGSFTYLTQGTTYKTRLVASIGAASFPCPFIAKTTMSTAIAVTGTIAVGAASKVIVTLANTYSCNLTFSLLGTFDSGGGNFSAPVTVLAGSYSGQYNLGSVIGCMKASITGNNYVTYLQTCGGQQYVFTLTITTTVCV
jgi:hypothetical protein